MMFPILLTVAMGATPTLSPEEIHLRDPFILPVPEEGKYYLYGTSCHLPGGTGFDAYVSRDLASWEGPFPVFRPDPGFWADRHFWAPEVHRVGDRFALLASFKSETACRGTQILMADSPRGPFKPHSQGPVTPRDWECLDGTLYVDRDRKPWMVFCHEWLQVQDGEICAIRLTKDLKESKGEPILLFKASDAPWTGTRPTYVTDGPFLHRTEQGALVMLWSSFGKSGYAQALARSESGTIRGPWTHLPEPLFKEDGGHGMLFSRLDDGQLMLILHQPNQKPLERPKLLPVGDDLTPR